MVLKLSSTSAGTPSFLSVSLQAIFHMKRFTQIFILAAFALWGGLAFTSCSKSGGGSIKQELDDKDKELEELRQLAELDKQEMENQYAEFAIQYGELKKSVRDDSLIAKLDAEQKRAEALLQELRNVKATSSAEILRLKKELETVRSVLRDYIRQVDSLQQLNQALIGERDEALAEVQRTQAENSTISAQNATLNEKVERAAQLNATGISLAALNKKSKNAKKSKDIKQFQVSFKLARNVTAEAGNRNVYVRLLKPNAQVVSQAGTFSYENKEIGFSASKKVEYTGEETAVEMFIPVTEYLSAGTYTAYIFTDGQMVGSGSLKMEK